MISMEAKERGDKNKRMCQYCTDTVQGEEPLSLWFKLCHEDRNIPKSGEINLSSYPGSRGVSQKGVQAHLS